MTETATQGLDEAPPAAFVNGDATPQQHRPARGMQQAPKGEVRGSPRQRKPDEANLEIPALMAWPETFTTSLRFHVAWRGALAAITSEQLAFVTDAGRELVEAGRAMAEEPDPARRIELVCTQALRQLERSLDSSARMIEALSGPGRDMLDILMASAPVRCQPD